MKKLTPRYKIWLLRRMRKSRKKLNKIRDRAREVHIVQAWFGEEIEEMISDRRPNLPPSTLCLKSNPDETLSFLEDWRKRFRAINPSNTNVKFEWFKRPKNPRAKKRINGFTDFSYIQEISTALSLLLTAEYDRVRQLIGGVPPTINLHEWKTPVFRRLFEIGFFDVLGLTKGVEDRYVTSGDIKTMKIISGSNASELQTASESILELSRFLGNEKPISADVEIALNNALSEAMINVSKHAYPDDHVFRHRHIGKWWVTASVDRVRRELTIVIYDQGATIPITFPKKDFSQSVRDFFESVLTTEPEFDYANDGSYIEGAMKPGRSQTNQKFRGLGLPEMKDLIDICGQGSLRIFSRGGECYYAFGQRLQRRSRRYSIGGTLIEWTLYLPNNQDNLDGQDHQHIQGF